VRHRACSLLHHLLRRAPRAETARAGGRTDPLGFGVAGLCFLAWPAAVLYGIYLIVPQLH